MTDGPPRPFSKLAQSRETAPVDEDVAQRRSPAVRAGWLALRLLVAAIAIRAALGEEPAAAVASLREADLRWIAVGAAAMVLTVAISALRWRSYLHAIGSIPVSPLRALRLTLVGGFFNAFLPTGVGGDAYKALRVGRRGRRSEAFASVLLDRFSGLVGLAVVAIVTIAVDLDDVPRRLSFVSEAIAVAVLTATLVPRASREWVLRRAHIPDRGRIGHALWRAAQAVAQANRSLRVAGLGYAWGIAAQAAFLGVHVAVAAAIGIEQPLGVLAAAAIVSQIAALVPLTINGLGFREAAYVWALGTAGVAREDGAAFSLAILALLLAVSAVGGIVYVATPEGSRDRPGKGSSRRH